MIIQVIIAKVLPEAVNYGNGVYIVFAFIFGRFLGIDHPKAMDDSPLDLKRKVLGWIALAVFIISFTPRPLYFEINEKAQVEKPGLEQVNLKPSKIIARRMIEIF